MIKDFIKLQDNIVVDSIRAESLEGIDGEWVDVTGTVAEKDYTYDVESKKFIKPQPHPSWVYDGTHCKPPKLVPQAQYFFKWDEEIKDWIKII